MASVTIEIIELDQDRKWVIEFRYSVYHGNYWYACFLGGQSMRFTSIQDITSSELIPEMVRSSLKQLLRDTKLENGVI